MKIFILLMVLMFNESELSAKGKLVVPARAFGHLLKSLRHNSGLTQLQLAEKLRQRGVTISNKAIGHYEAHALLPPDKTFQSMMDAGLADILGVDEEQLREVWQQSQRENELVKQAGSPFTDEAAIALHGELMQQVASSDGVSAEVRQILQESQQQLDDLLVHRHREEVLADLRETMDTEQVGVPTLNAYSSDGVNSRYIIEPLLSEVRQKLPELYQQLLSELADGSEQAEQLLQQYLKGERLLSDDELKQLCLYTACTMMVAPKLAVERVLSKYREVQQDIVGMLDEVEQHSLDAALSVFAGNTVENLRRLVRRALDIAGVDRLEQIKQEDNVTELYAGREAVFRDKFPGGVEKFLRGGLDRYNRTLVLIPKDINELKKRLQERIATEFNEEEKSKRLEQLEDTIAAALAIANRLRR